MNLSPVSSTLGAPEDFSWLGSAYGTEHPRSITLDNALFTATPFPNKLVKSGTVLGKVTATGKYGPFKADASDGTELPVGVLAATVDLSNGGLVVAGADSPAALQFWGVLVAAKMPQGTATSATTPGALDSVATTYPAVLTTAQQKAVAQFLAKFTVI